MNRVLAAARLHLVHPLVVLGVPWLVVALSFAINWGVWRLADIGAQPNGGFTGGVASLYITVLIVYVQAVNQLLPFAMGVSLSRRAFYLGTALMAVVQSLGYGIAIAVLDAIEGATAGWGVGISFWAPGPLDVANFALQIVVSGAPMLACAFVGIGIGVVHKRWGPTGLWALLVGSLVVFGGLAVLATWLHAWGAIGRWLADMPLLALAVGLPAVIALLVAGLSFAGLRRVVP